MSLSKAKDACITVLATSSGSIFVRKDSDGITLGISDGHNVELPERAILLSNQQRRELRELLAVKPKRGELSTAKRKRSLICGYCGAKVTKLYDCTCCNARCCSECISDVTSECCACLDNAEAQCHVCGVPFRWNIAANDCPDCENYVCDDCWAVNSNCCKKCAKKEEEDG